jgi:outer membrane protein OmpA-like peptidoglycan-associated protein/uncharacterized protein YidB (DUF937 family)
MGAMDMVLTEVESKFGLSSGNASSLLSSLLSYVNEQGTGLKGLLDRFKQVGLGDSVSSWLSGSAKPISADNVENALGTNAISTIASRAGLSAATAASALAFMLPKVVQRLAPGGVLPTNLPSEFSSYVSGRTAAATSGVRQAAYAGERAVNRTGMQRFLWPILGLALLAILGGVLWNRMALRNGAFNVEDQVRMAEQRATEAVAALKPGFSAQDLVGALNLDVINFASGSAEIPQDNYSFLNRAAAAIKSAPAGTIIEIGGNTDNTGDAASNMQLSQQRADAVRNYLVSQGVDPSMLLARGYGNTRPVASDDTEEGKFRNRHIQFTVTQ